MNDMINRPAHYTQGKIECLDAIESMMPERSYRDFYRAQIIKYVWRCEEKGYPVADLQKANFYLQKLLKLHQGVDHPAQEDKSSHTV